MRGGAEFGRVKLGGGDPTWRRAHPATANPAPVPKHLLLKHVDVLHPKVHRVGGGGTDSLNIAEEGGLKPPY